MENAPEPEASPVPPATEKNKINETQPTRIPQDGAPLEETQPTPVAPPEPPPLAETQAAQVQPADLSETQPGHTSPPPVEALPPGRVGVYPAPGDAGGAGEPPAEVVSRPGRSWRPLAYIVLGLLLLLFIGIVSGYSGYLSAIDLRLGYEATQVSDEAQRQFTLGIEDMQAGRYDLARQRFEFVIGLNPNYPGITEALAQASGLLLGLSERAAPDRPPARPRMFYLATATMKYTHPAVPGDVLVLRAESDKQFGGLFRFSVEASAGRHLVASGSITLALVDALP